MALTAAEKKALEALAVRTETYATWHTGVREDTLNALAKDIRGVANGDADKLNEVEDTEAAKQAEIEAKRAELEAAQVEAEKAAAKGRRS